MPHCDNSEIVIWTLLFFNNNVAFDIVRLRSYVLEQRSNTFSTDINLT